jgi:hypothetical protein
MFGPPCNGPVLVAQYAYRHRRRRKEARFEAPDLASYEPNRKTPEWITTRHPGSYG